VSEGPSIDDYSAEFWRRAKVASNVLHLARLVRPQDEQVGALYRYCLFELDGAECGVAHYAVLIEPGEIIWTGETAASCASSTSCRLRRTIRRSSASCASSRRRRADPPPGAAARPLVLGQTAQFRRRAATDRALKSSKGRTMMFARAWRLQVGQGADPDAGDKPVGDCCVFCSGSDQLCPPKQQSRGGG
jgi:hypothetical protein